jgi:hypothetical protein
VNLHASQLRLKQRKVSSHPPSMICPFPISPPLSLPLETLRLVSWVNLIIKTKRIAERSATNCDTHTHTHTHTHTDRQSSLDKYMINYYVFFHKASLTSLLFFLTRILWSNFLRNYGNRWQCNRRKAQSIPRALSVLWNEGRRPCWTC